MVHFKACGCGGQHLERIHRSSWMRLVFPSRGLYYCARCSARFLLTPAGVIEATADAPRIGNNNTQAA